MSSIKEKRTDCVTQDTTLKVCGEKKELASNCNVYIFLIIACCMDGEINRQYLSLALQKET